MTDPRDYFPNPDSVPDDVPLADAVEQAVPAVESPEAAGGADAPPLESDPVDWQEQRMVVEDDAEDDFR